MNPAVEYLRREAKFFVNPSPKSTRTIRSHLRPLTTSAVLKLLKDAERSGIVARAGTGADVLPRSFAFRHSAAELSEIYWTLAN